MTRSAWSVWLHPFRSAAELADCGERLRDLEQENLGLQAELQADRRYASDLEKIRETLEKELRQLRETNARQEERIREWMGMKDDLETALDQLEKMMSLRDKMNAMRRDYESRIDNLELKLKSARVKGPQFADPEKATDEDTDLLEPGEIHNPVPATIRLEAPERLHVIRPADDTHWLRPLPEDEPKCVE